MIYEEDPITGQVLWPAEILVKARKAVAAYQYAPGAERMLMEGKCDHWHAVQVACYGISGYDRRPVEEAIKQIPPKDRRVDLQNKIWLVEQDLKRRTAERDRHIKQTVDDIQKTLDAKLRRIFKNA